jgi:ATP-dependent protease ClpP protease subunit
VTTNPLRSPDFRPDPARGIFLSEQINQSTLDRLTPDVLRLQMESRGPITLFIDSPGGNTTSARTLRRLLRASDQDGNSPCRLITVATGTAASAAADLLMSGDYAVAYPHVLILCHGVRRSQDKTLTHEKAFELAKTLASSNEKFAIQLADNCISRFIFRVAMMLGQFPAIKEHAKNPEMSHAACFIEAVKDRIDDELVNVLRHALQRSEDNDALDTAVDQSFAGKDIANMPMVQFDLLVLKAILDYEAQKHESDESWSFRERGLETVQDKLQLLIDKYSEHHAEMTNLLCTRWGKLFLSSEEKEQLTQLPEDKHSKHIENAVGATLSKLWFFFVSVCRSLQKDDYWMSAQEAYWLGLIDEIVGLTDLPCPRIFVEYPPPENASPSEEQQPGN